MGLHHSAGVKSLRRALSQSEPSFRPGRPNQRPAIPTRPSRPRSCARPRRADTRTATACTSFVQPSRTRSWIQRLVIRDRRREFGLGSMALVSLAEAREKARANRKLAREGGDPLAENAVATACRASPKPP